jgi:Na+/proline symporter
LTNRLANVAVSLFVMFWGLYYPLSSATYLYLNITASIFLSGAFVSVVGGLYWSRASLAGGYAAMLGGAVGAIVPFFFWGWDANKSGFLAYGLALAGLLLGSLFGKKAPATALSAAQ